MMLARNLTEFQAARNRKMELTILRTDPFSFSTQNTRNTSSNAAALDGARITARETLRRPKPNRTLEPYHIGCSLPPRARIEAHRLKRLEPYEGKLSSTVLRGGRAGDSLPLLA